VAPGRLIVFEGGEGAGKSTQLARLAARLSRAGVACQQCREPGGTPVGDEIRRLLLDHDGPMHARTEALLFMASRAELVSRVVRPALAAGTLVLLDRFFLSTYAYQIHGRGLGDADVRAANHVATEGLAPDVTLLLALPASIGLARAAQRSERDRIEQAEHAFHERVEAAFAEFATPAWQARHEECGPIVSIDASGTADAVEARVLDALSSRFPELRDALVAMA
jgi:dTMP kinase